jgi:hypothetical protein
VSVVVESRRELFGRIAGVGLLSGLAGCTVVGTVAVDVLVENPGPREERVEYYIDREGATTEARTVELAPDGERTISAGLERGDAVVVSKEDSGYECTVTNPICRNPTLQVDIGWGALAVAGECFTLRPR